RPEEHARRDPRAGRKDVRSLLVHRAGDGDLGCDGAHPAAAHRARGGGTMSLHAVILAGGSGTRFWPLSRAKKPKQFLALVTDRSLIAETFARVGPLCPPERTWVVCGQQHADAVREALPRLPAQ